jgi:hypothetical protein
MGHRRDWPPDPAAASDQRLTSGVGNESGHGADFRAMRPASSARLMPAIRRSRRGHRFPCSIFTAETQRTPRRIQAETSSYSEVWS